MYKQFKALIDNEHHTKLIFLLVGIWNTIFGYLAFVVLDAILADLFSKRYAAYMSAAILSNILSIVNAYVFHKYFTFKSTIKGLRIIGEFFKFSTTYIFTFILGLLLLPVFVEVLHVMPKIAAALIIGLCTGISYVGHMNFSFRR